MHISSIFECSSFCFTFKCCISNSKEYNTNTTFLAPPSEPTDLQVIDVTSRGATLTWKPPASTGGSEITGYVVEKKLEYAPKWEKVATLEAFTLQYKFENLKEKSEYLFRVFAENAIGLSIAATSEIVQLRTHASKFQLDTIRKSVGGPSVLLLRN